MAVMLMTLSAVAILQVDESEGAASKGQHDKLTYHWVSKEVVTLTTTSGAKIVDITAEIIEQSSGSLRYTLKMKDASELQGYEIRMVKYNYITGAQQETTTMDLYLYEGDSWEVFGGGYYEVFKAGGFKADFLVVHKGEPVAESGTARLDFKYDATTIHDYTTELKYDINGGTGGPTASTERSDSSETSMSYVAMTVSSIKDMKRDGYVFKGWSKSLSDTTNLIQPGASVTVPAGEATTLYAIWAQDTVTVTLMDGDALYVKRVIGRGEVPSLPTIPNKADSTFVGWYTDKGLTEKWDSSSKVTKDMTLYAGWKPDFYFITDPVADCKVTKVSGTTYLFDATVSKDYESSAKVTSWTVLKGDEVIYESTGPYMTYQFMEYGTYDVKVKLVNDYGVESVHTETITIEEPSSIDLKSIAIFLIVAVLVVALVVRYLI